MKKNTIIITLTAVILLIIGVAYYYENYLTTEEVTAESIRDRALDVLINAETYKFNMSQIGKIDGVEKTRFTYYNSIANVKNNKYEMDYEYKFSSNKMTSKLYIIGEDIYATSEGKWTKSKVSDVNSMKSIRLDEKTKLLKNSDVEIVSDETINGENYWILFFKLNKEQLMEMIGDPSKQKEISEEQIEEVLKNTKIKEWINKADYTTKKIEIMTSTPQERLGKVETIETIMIMEIYDYNEPVNIFLPEEAKGATIV